jgi:hypothetical protein
MNDIENTPRKIVQICTGGADNVRIIALCNDGTLWTAMGITAPKWHQVPGVPQPEPEIKAK